LQLATAQQDVVCNGAAGKLTKKEAAVDVFLRAVPTAAAL
jgi:hypothetical protein